MTVQFELTTLLPVPRERAFDASLDIDLHTRSMAASREQAVAGVTSGLIGPGESVTWRARHFGVLMRLTSRITAYDRPARFVDEQTSGPFARFRHEHLFFPEGESTRMVDRIEFTARSECSAAWSSACC